jgi:hypothetical protein
VWGREAVFVRIGCQGVQWVGVLVVPAERREEGCPHGTYPGSTVKIAYRVLENPLEKQGQFCRRPCGILFRKTQHRVLDDVQRRVLVANRELGLFEGPPLDAGEEIREFIARSQGTSPLWMLPCKK